MKRLVLIFLFLISPLLSMEDEGNEVHPDNLLPENPLFRMYRDRLKSGKQIRNNFQRDIEIALKGKIDVVKTTIGVINAQRHRLMILPTFNDEVERLLTELIQPEELFSSEQRHALLDIQTMEHLEPLDLLIKRISQFIELNKGISDHAKVLQLAADQTCNFQPEWDQLIQRISISIKEGDITKADLLEVFKWVSFFYNRIQDINQSSQSLSECLPGSLPLSLNGKTEELLYIQGVEETLIKFFQSRGEILWAILKSTLSLPDMPEAFHDIPTEYFKCNSHHIEVYLTRESEDEATFHVNPVTFPASTPRKTLSLGMSSPSPRKSTPRRIEGTQSTPVMLVKPKRLSFEDSPRKMVIPSLSPLERLAHHLQIAFTLPDHWGTIIKDIREKNTPLFNADFIVDSLNPVLIYYKNFKVSYLANLSTACDVLTPCAAVKRPGHNPLRVPLSLAAVPCFLGVNGSFCVDITGIKSGNITGWESSKGNVRFLRGRYMAPICSGEEPFLYYLETLWGVSSEPAAVLLFDNLKTKKPVNPHNQITKEFAESILRNPERYSDEQAHHFIGAFPKQTEESLFSLLQKIAKGQETFSHSLDPISCGTRLLFSLLIQECIDLNSLALVKGEKLSSLKRVREGTFLQPLFRVFDEGMHQYTGRNIFFYLPIFNQVIPQEVKDAFLSNDLNLTLTMLLTQLNALQKEYSTFVASEDYGLDELVFRDEIEQEILKRRTLGLSITGRIETITLLIQNFKQMCALLQSKNITYAQLLEKLRPMEYECVMHVTDTADRKTQKSSIFFKDVMPTIFERLHRMHKQSLLDPMPFYTGSLEQIRLLEDGCQKYLDVIKGYEGQMESLANQKLSCLSRIENTKQQEERYQEKKSSDIEAARRNIAMLREEIASNKVRIGELKRESPPSEQKEAYEDFIEIPLKTPRTEETKPGDEHIPSTSPLSSPSGIVEKTELELRSELKAEQIAELEELNQQILAAIDQHKETIQQYEVTPSFDTQELEAEITKLNKGIKALTQHLSFTSLQKELEAAVPAEAQRFIREKYQWAEENGIFHANSVIKAFEYMSDTEKPIIYESLEGRSYTGLWADVHCVQKPIALPLVYAQLLESERSVTEMACDLMANADVSSCDVDLAFTIMERLFHLIPQPEVVHPSWLELVRRAQRSYMALPPHTRNYFISHATHSSVEAAGLLEATRVRSQLERNEQYCAILSGKRSGKEELSEPEMPGHLYRQLFTGLSKIDPKEAFLYQALCDLLLLPTYSPLKIAADEDPGSLGLESCPAGKGGIFRHEYKGGEHYLHTWSLACFALFKSPQILSTKARVNLTSHALPLMHLQWLRGLHSSCPDTLFRPWFIKTLIEKSKKLQDLIHARWDITFKDILLHLYPEIYFVIANKFNVSEKGSDKTPDKVLSGVLQSIRSECPQLKSLSAVEQRGVSLDWCKGGTRNILTLLQAWDRLEDEALVAVPFNLDAAATEFLKAFSPVGYPPQVLDILLEIASHFKIDFSRINQMFWSDPQLLLDLRQRQVSLRSIAYAASMRVGYPIFLECEGDSTTISGVRGNFEILCELINLFPETTDLSLPHNGIWSIKPLMETLLKLRHLSCLSLADNPLHNLAPFATLKPLRAQQPQPQLGILKLTLNNTSFREKQPTPIPERAEDLASKQMEALRKSIKESVVIPLNKIANPLGTIQTYVNDTIGIYRSPTCETDFSALFQKSHSEILKRIAECLLEDNSEDLELIICLWERLAEKHWKTMLNRGSPHYIEVNPLKSDRGSDRVSVNPLNIPLTRVFDLLSQRDPRASAFKLLFALNHGLPFMVKPKCLTFSQLPNLDARHLTQLTIRPTKFGRNPIQAEDLKALRAFENLTHLSICGNGLTHLLDLPYLPCLQYLDLSNNAITSVEGLMGEHIKFPHLNVLILSNNQLSDNCYMRILSLSKLNCLILKDNLLTKIPLLGSLQLRYLDISANNIRENLPNDIKTETKTRIYHPQRQ